MKKQIKFFLYILVFIVFLIGSGLAYRTLSQKYKSQPRLNIGLTPEAPATPDIAQTPENQASPGAETEEKLEAPDFKAIDMDGNEVSLKDFRGTPVVLNFWASWCPPCKSEMPDFNKVSQEYTEDQLQFLMVDLVDGKRETLETGKKYILDKGFTFKVLYDTTEEAAYTYGIRSIPSTLFIDKDGYIIAGWEGAMDEAALREGIALILDEE